MNTQYPGRYRNKSNVLKLFINEIWPIRLERNITILHFVFNLWIATYNKWTWNNIKQHIHLFTCSWVQLMQVTTAVCYTSAIRKKCVSSTNHCLLGNKRYTYINHYLNITLMTYCIKRYAARRLKHRHIIILYRSLYKYVL